MPFLSQRERAFLRAVSALSYANPFLPDRLQFESQALGAEFIETAPYWSLRAEDPEEPRANVWKIIDRLGTMLGELRARVEGAARPGDLALYEDAVLFFVYHRYAKRFYRAAVDEAQGAERLRWDFYAQFLDDWRHYLEIDGLRFPMSHEPRHTFACFFQIQRAFHHIFTSIIGSSLPAARLRAAVWESVFTHDMQRYARSIYARMGEFVTLITGPSGSGKELVARAIALSRYRPFDDKRLAFEQDPAGPFHAINITSLSPTLIESELFGHRRGAFTGALEDRRGWLEVCSPLGTVFLDEIGDLDPAIQVKLLRVIETRTFHAVGDLKSRSFEGKLMVATNRNLAQAIRQGGFREDLYYRLCSDQVVTPSLSEQLRANPQVLHDLVLFLAQRVAGADAEPLAAEVEKWIRGRLAPDYAWPGNYRELEQCVKNVLIRSDYQPAASRQNEPDRLWDDFHSGRLTADELLGRYCALVYRQTGNYQETARRLGLDRRTVKSRITTHYEPQMNAEERR
jgi:transcriptional regulator with AAA-type ATPase domain